MDVVDFDNDLETDKPYADAVNQLKRVTGGISPKCRNALVPSQKDTRGINLVIIPLDSPDK